MAEAPESFGPYRVLRPLARGGMAQLLLARKEGPGGFAKLVAVKVVLPHHAGNADFVKMFLDEARLAARLDHPNIVHVQDFGEAAGTYYLAMEYLQGKDLGWFIRKEPLPPVIAALVVSAACSGLHHAHVLVGDDGAALGIVHRDISPTNVFLTLQGAVKVLDFGIAKAAGKLSDTKTGWMKGKPLYMSPEQIWSRPLDARSDVWALGVVLYELLSGVRPFEREVERAVLEAIEKEPPPPLRTARPDVPAALVDIVMKCLEKDPANRYPTADALRRALDQFVAQHSTAPAQGQLQEFIEVSVPLAERTPPPPAVQGMRPPDAQAAIGTVLRAEPAPTQQLETRHPAARASRLPRWSLGLGLAAAAIATVLWATNDEAPRPVVGPPPVLARPVKTAPPPAPPPEPAQPPVEAMPEPAPSAPQQAAPVARPAERTRPAPPPVAAPKPVARQVGQLKVRCAPYGEVFVDGQDRGLAEPALELEVEVGLRRVKCVHPTSGEASADVSVTAGQLIEKQLRY